MAATINIAHQAFILARLSEFCQYHAKIQRFESDPWRYMREKLLQMEPELAALKGELLAATTRKILAEMRAGRLTDEACADLKTLLERLLSRGDFVDVAMHIYPGAGADAAKAVEAQLKRIRAHHAFLEERLPKDQRDPNWERLVGDLRQRLEVDKLEAAMKRKPSTPRRRAMVLRRLRRNVAEYCTVMRIPTEASDTFTPFMLPRVEALIAVGLRFLNVVR